MIDWTLAERIARFVAGNPPGALAPGIDLDALAAQSERLVGAYTGLRPPGPLPPPEALGRPEWVAANVASMRKLLDPATARLGEGLGPLQPTLRGVAGALLGVQIGVLTGYLSQRVLGQYDLVLLDADAPPRLLFVAPNLDDAARSLSADPEQLTTWVALHEVTHALQFASVPWLHDHLGGLIRELIAQLEVSIDARRVVRMPNAADIRAFLDAVRRGELFAFLAGPGQRDLLDRMQAVMAVVEGYAEHVMDAVGEQLLPSLRLLRDGLEERRSSRSAPARLLGRLLGFELKLRQYELGKGFCDAVVTAGGIDALNAVWRAPDALPTLAELESPDAWLARTHVPVVTKS